MYDTLGGGFRSFHKVVVAYRNVDVEASDAPAAWHRNLQNRYVPFKVTLDGRAASMLALYASGADGLHDVLDHLESWDEQDSERIVLLGDFNVNGEGRKAIRGLVDARPTGDTRIEHHSPDTVMYRGVSVGDAAVGCACCWSDHYPLTCAVGL